MKKILLVGVSLIVTGGAVGGYLFMKRERVGPIPIHIKDQISYVLLLPKTEGYSIDPKEVQLNLAEKVVTIPVVIQSSGASVVLSEQPLPDTFTDIPQYYEKLVEAMGQYKQIDTVNGTVTLTRPEELKGRQTAVLNANGTLLFARPSSDLSDDDWRRFFNDLYIYR